MQFLWTLIVKLTAMLEDAGYDLAWGTRSLEAATGCKCSRIFSLDLWQLLKVLAEVKQSQSDRPLTKPSNIVIWVMRPRCSAYWRVSADFRPACSCLSLAVCFSVLKRKFKNKDVKYQIPRDRNTEQDAPEHRGRRFSLIPCKNYINIIEILHVCLLWGCSCSTQAPE